MRKAPLQLCVVFLFVFAFLAFARADSSSADQYDLKLPVGIAYDTWSYYVPRDNPLSRSKVELGRNLFFDKRLSADGTVSCATCHDPKFAFADGKKVAEGIGGRRGTRNSPTLLNAMFNGGQFWDGRAESLEEQAKMPLLNPDEMGNGSHDQVVKRVGALSEYTKAFQEAFGSPATIESIARAIASFERTLVSGNSPFDRFVAGDRNALTQSAQRGMGLFRTRARCAICHNINSSFPFLTDQNYRNTGVAANFAGFESLSRRAVQLAQGDVGTAMAALDKHPGKSELGRFAVTGNALDIGAFRTPSLRNVELTAPYFHDGSAATLADVLRFYLKGGIDNPSRDWELQPVDLNEHEQEDIIAFLKSLTSDDARRIAEESKLSPP